MTANNPSVAMIQTMPVTTAEVAAAVAHLLCHQPQGCVFDLDRETPAFVD